MSHHHLLKQQLSITDTVTENLNSFYWCRFMCQVSFGYWSKYISLG